jgi:predicted phage tail protein
MDIPSVPDADSGKERKSPFFMVGLALVVYGLILAGVAGLTAIKGASFKVIALNAGAGAAMIIIGLAMRLSAAKKQRRTV